VFAGPPTPPESDSSLSEKSDDGHDTDADDGVGGHSQNTAVQPKGGPARGSGAAASSAGGNLGGAGAATGRTWAATAPRNDSP